MATAGTGFAAGLRAGGGLVSQALENERLDEAAARQAEEFKWKRTDQERLRKQQGEEDAAWDNYRAASTGLSPDMIGKVKDTYGMTPAQIAAAGPGLKDKLAGYDVPDASDLQNVPAAPAAPAGGLQTPGRFTADQVVQGAPDRAGRESALGAIAAAKRDVAGVRASDEQQLKIKQDQIFNTVGKMTDDQIVARAKTLNTNDSNVPILYTGKGKGGYDFMTTDPDGSPGKKFSLNMAQMRQLVVAQELGKNDFGREALVMATNTHKDIGDSIGKWNEAQGKMQQGNTTALHYANADANDAARTANDAARTAIMRKELGLKQDKQKMDSLEVMGVTPEGVWQRSKQNGAITLEKFPEGMKDEQKVMVIKKYRSQYEPKISNDGQTMVVGPDTYAANPNYGKKTSDKTINTEDQWFKTTPGAGGDVLSSLKAYNEGRAKPGEAAAAPAPAGGAPAPTAAPAAAPPAPAGGGLTLSTPYTPPPDSIAGRAKAEREAKAAQRNNFRDTNAQAATIEADRILQAGDAEAGYRLMSFEGFKNMPPDKQMAVQRLVLGR